MVLLLLVRQQQQLRRRRRRRRPRCIHSCCGAATEPRPPPAAATTAAATAAIVSSQPPLPASAAATAAAAAAPPCTPRTAVATGQGTVGRGSGRPTQHPRPRRGVRNGLLLPPRRVRLVQKGGQTCGDGCRRVRSGSTGSRVVPLLLPAAAAASPSVMVELLGRGRCEHQRRRRVWRVGRQRAPSWRRRRADRMRRRRPARRRRRVR